MKSNEKPIEVTQLGPHDVVLGRGNRSKESLGNVRFRETLRVIIEDGGIRELDGHTDHELSHLIVAQIKGIGGKFVSKLCTGTANEIADGLSDRIVYEEVCDAVACEKVMQYIHHKLRRSLCLRAVNKFPSSTSIKAIAHLWLHRFEVNKTLDSSMPSRKSSQQAPRLPARPTAESLSRMALHPVGVPNKQERCLRRGISHGSSLVGSHQQMQPPIAIPTDDSQACVQEDHLATSILPNLSRRDHVVSTPPPTIVADDRVAILQLLQRQEMALLHDAFIKSRSN